MNRYNYEVFEEEIDSFVEDLGCPDTRRAWQTLRMVVLGSAWVEFNIWDDAVDTRKGLSLAWEDMAIAFLGYSGSLYTGAVVALWGSIDEDLWDGFKETVAVGIKKADEATPKVVPRRYFQSYRSQPPRTPKEGFKLPNIVPVGGRRMRDWAQRSGHDPFSVEVQMAKIEELERMGLITVGGPGDKSIRRVVQNRKPSLRLVKGDRDGRSGR